MTLLTSGQISKPASTLTAGSANTTIQLTPVQYQLNDGTLDRGWFNQGTQALFSDVNSTNSVTIGAGPTEAILNSIEGISGERATEFSRTTFTLSTQNEISTPVAVPTGKKIISVLAAIKVTNYSSALNGPLVFYPEISFFQTAAADEFELIEADSAAPAQGDTVGHTGSDSGALEGAYAVRLRREDSTADITATVDCRLILTLR